MIEEHALVVSVNDEALQVKINQQSSCSGCSAKGSCGTSALAKLFGNKTALFMMPMDSKIKKAEIHEGDSVVIGLEDAHYLKASALIYLLPILFLFSFALISEQLFSFNDLGIMVSGGLGLWFGFKVSNQIAIKNSAFLKPLFIRKVLFPF